MSFEHETRGGANLAPARYGDSGGHEGFRSAFPWRVLLGILLVFAGIISLHSYLTYRKVEALRAEVLSLVETEILPVREELVALREQISKQVLARYRRETFDSPFVAPGFDLDVMREEPVLTLRLGRRGELAHDEVELVVEHGAPDDIGSCLGVPNQPAAQLYEGGDFLGEGLVAEVEGASSELELRGLRDQLERRIHDVLPTLREASRSGRLLLAIDRPDEALVEVSVIDLGTGRDLARLLAKAEGSLLTAAIDLGGGPRPRGGAARGEEPALRGAVDCGVATQLRVLLDRDEPGPAE